MDDPVKSERAWKCIYHVPHTLLQYILYKENWNNNNNKKDDNVYTRSQEAAPNPGVQPLPEVEVVLTHRFHLGLVVNTPLQLGAIENILRLWLHVNA